MEAPDESETHLRRTYPAGVPCWVDTTQPDPAAGARFYGELFGWDVEDTMPPDAPGHYFMARLDGADVAAVGSQPDGAPPMAEWNTYISVEAADESATKVRDAGGSVLAEPFDVLDAGRMAVCADPSGAVFSLWQPGLHKGAQVVNAPGTWNWSDLNTRDPHTAKAFYGAVFGWQAKSVEFEGDTTTMWCLPGYGDFLETVNPGVRQMHEDFGAPEGFTDAIGWLLPMSDPSQDGVPPHWSVTFAVDDTDAVAAKAVELDGSVVVPPFDAGVVRVAVLQDPAGATLSVNRFDPS